MSINKYSYPLHNGDYTKISGDHSYDKTGRLEHALDFVCVVGTPFYAALGGKVVFARDNFRIGGSDIKRFFDRGNRVVVRHENGEYSAYEHFRYKGLRVKVGEEVEEGQLLGYTGKTGYVPGGPHLHFEVFHFTGPNADEDYQTDPVDFKTA